jgi:hypothetical protein
LRRREPALHNSSRENTVAHAEGNVVTLMRTHGETSVAAFFNLCDAAGSAQLRGGDRWDEVLRADPEGTTFGKVSLDPWGFRIFRTGPASQLSESP